MAFPWQRLFGFGFTNPDEIDKQGQPIPPEQLPPSTLESPVLPITDDGAVISPANAYGFAVDLDASVRTEADLINQYRSMSLNATVDTAIENIVSEAITYDSEESSVSIVLDKLTYAENIKQVIREEFNNVLTLLDFNNQAYDLFRRWYIDGRIYFHVVIDVNDPRSGVQELRIIDPRKIKKIREVQLTPSLTGGSAGVQNIETVKEYWVYNDQGFSMKTGMMTGVMQHQSVTQNASVIITNDAIAGSTSGLTDPDGTMVLSYLHKAIKPLNVLSSMTDAMAINRIARAPERRIFYIDVGDMPHSKANEYMKQTMLRYKNKVTYDSTTGVIKDDRKIMTMLEDYWLPRRANGRGTEIDTLPGAQNLDQIDDIVMMQKDLYKSLNIPPSRLEADQAFNLGRSSEISRDEILFSKFIHRLRLRFSQLFLDVLGKQLILKAILSLEEWEMIRSDIRFEYVSDSHFIELKESEVMMNRLQVLQAAQPYVGIYFSRESMKTDVLHQSEEEQELEAERIAQEMQIYGDITQPTEPEQGGPQ